jgi:hypothetical protein
VLTPPPGTSIGCTLASSGTSTIKRTTIQTIRRQRSFKGTSSIFSTRILSTSPTLRRTPSRRQSLDLPSSAFPLVHRKCSARHAHLELARSFSQCHHRANANTIVPLPLLSTQVRRHCVQGRRQTVGDGTPPRLPISILAQHSAVVVPLPSGTVSKINHTMCHRCKFKKVMMYIFSSLS